MSSPVRGYEPFSSHQFRSFDCHRFRKVERLSLFSFCILCIDHVNDLSLVNVLTVLDIGDILYESSVHLEREFFSVYWRTDSLISSNRWISLMVLHAKLARSLDLIIYQMIIYQWFSDVKGFEGMKEKSSRYILGKNVFKVPSREPWNTDITFAFRCICVQKCILLFCLPFL